MAKIGELPRIIFRESAQTVVMKDWNMQRLCSLEDIGTTKAPFGLNTVMGSIRVVDDAQRLAVFFRKPSCLMVILGLSIICFSRFVLEFPSFLAREVSVGIFVLSLLGMAVFCFVLCKVVLSAVKYDFKIPYFCYDKEERKITLQGENRVIDLNDVYALHLLNVLWLTRKKGPSSGFMAEISILIKMDSGFLRYHVFSGNIFQAKRLLAELRKCADIKIISQFKRRLNQSVLISSPIEDAREHSNERKL